MRFSWGYPFTTCPPIEEFLTAQALMELAASAEAAGFGAVYVTEHPAPAERWRQTGGHDALDPFVALSFAAAATSQLQLLTNLTVVPYRNPFMLAKAVATLDRVSDGRVILGMGTGYLKGEYHALGVDFDERNALFDEAVDVMRMAWTGEPVTYEGLHFSARDITSQPTPARQPHPPLWLGGNSKLTRRRVAEWGQGWMPLPNPAELAARRRSPPLETTEQLRDMLAYLHDHAASVGRTAPVDVMYMCFEGGAPGTPDWNPQQHLEALHELAEAGVTWIAGNASGRTRAEVIDNLTRYGEEIIAALAPAP
ncbi:LLM class F420-dependent oxidoreductase [Rhabdothermincola salaria]|uniref:LLM class F420-dependent oxidoreductase n=1 Tax=Rhabdothermincola salaria TaxID=2903142 RepID=UPI001E637D77|nr:LLM class F420-dependent oxidoreductase [Rhabdothermincola salaria]MCD9622840.1 LLM class F420-dependent oxidoreductase [Rhabdothermincola salaria]